MTHLSTHVLDTVTGSPAVGVAIRLLVAGQEHDTVTDLDGRAAFDVHVGPGTTARITFDLGTYFAGAGCSSFYAVVPVDFVLPDGDRCHVPLIAGPHAYSTYRGS